MTNARERFILLATASYTILALAWIFLTDQLLSVFIDIESLLWLSTAKGVLFVITSAALFFMALRAVPAAKDTGHVTLLDTVTAGIAPERQAHWLMYAFALIITLAMLLVREGIAAEFQSRPLLILFMFPIVLSALLGGLGPGMLSTTVAATGLAYLAIPPIHSFRITAYYDLIQWLFLIINGVSVSLLSELLRRSLAKSDFNRYLLDTVVSGTSDAVFVKDTQGRYILINAAAASIVGKNLDEIIGRDDYFLFPDASARELMDADQAIMSSGLNKAFEEHVVTFDGKELDFLVNKGPVFGQSGQVIGVFGISRDITERKRVEATYHSLYDNIMNSVVHCRVIFESNKPIDLLYIAVNPAFAKVTGIAANPVGKLISEVIPGYCQHNQESLAVFGRVAETGEPTHWEHYLPQLDRWFSFYIFSMGRDEITIISENISERKRAEKKLQLAASVFTHAREGIMITETDGTIIEINEAFSRITGYRRDEILGKNPRILSSGRHKKDYYLSLWRDLSHHGYWSGEIWNRRKNGEVYAEILTISSVRDISGNTLQYVALFTDITAFKEHEKQLEYLAHYDALTQLPNRVLLADRIGQAMSNTRRNEQLLAVVYLDLDGFKAINDKYGHDIGDQLLVSVAIRMKQSIRENDTFARLGGDEFVAVLLDLDDIEASVPMITRLLTAAAQPLNIGGELLQVSASLGVTFYPQVDEADADHLLRQADQAMYQAKLKGKNRYHVFDAEQDLSVRSYHESIECTRLAMSNREFVLYYQPKVDMRRGTIIGAEALIRWQHPEQGLLSPAAFLPIIENHPLAVEVGEWVIDTALSQMESWGLEGLNIPVSVNVCARQLQLPDFVSRLQAILVRHPKIQPNRLKLELLETSALEDVAHVTHIINSCREIGVKFALDDFGTGYSSLTYLKRLPASQLKIDQSFVRDMLDDPDDLAILEGVLGMANAFRRQVIAEGVETIEHGQMLLQLGCEFGQGYGIAKPMPAHEMPGWSANWQIDPAWRDVSAVSQDDLPLLFATVEHRAWIMAVENHLNGVCVLVPTHDEHLCRFGDWLDCTGLANYGTEANFQRLKQIHHDVHALADELVKLHAAGLNSEAQSRMNELHQLRDRLSEQVKILLQNTRQLKQKSKTG